MSYNIVSGRRESCGSAGASTVRKNSAPNCYDHSSSEEYTDDNESTGGESGGREVAVLADDDEDQRTQFLQKSRRLDAMNLMQSLKKEEIKLTNAIDKSSVGDSLTCSVSSASSTATSSSFSQIRRYGMNECTDSPPTTALKLPRTLSTSVLKVKYRSSFWEKFWEERSKRDM